MMTMSLKMTANATYLNGQKVRNESSSSKEEDNRKQFALMLKRALFKEE